MHYVLVYNEKINYSESTDPFINMDKLWQHKYWVKEQVAKWYMIYVSFMQIFKTAQDPFLYF